MTAEEANLPASSGQPEPPENDLLARSRVAWEAELRTCQEDADAFEKEVQSHKSKVKDLEKTLNRSSNAWNRLGGRPLKWRRL